MPDSITQSFVQRLVTEQGFRESAQQVFKQVESTAASDLLQRCRALNACFKQGLAPKPASEPALDSSSDSDISSGGDCGSSSSSAACQAVQQAVTCTDQFRPVQNQTIQTVVHIRPTPVRHAAAITIQRWFRQCHHTPCSHTEQVSSLLDSTDTIRQQNAAACIQMCWRRYRAKPQMPARAANPSGQPAMLTRPKQRDEACCEQGEQADTQEARPTGSSNRLTDLPSSPMDGMLKQLADVRIRSAAGLRRMSSSGDTPAVGLAPIASAVVQRAVERAHQVQGMEARWLAAQMGNTSQL